MKERDEALAAYYARRAPEYERIYALPERQADLARLRAMLPPLFAGRDVLEIACGTGYWTPIIAQQARSVLATDVGREVLELARLKPVPEGRVRFAIADAFDADSLRALRPDDHPWDAAFVGFLWSHIALSRIPAFLDGLGSVLAPGSLVVAIDNRPVEGSSTPIARVDAEGNSYQLRHLEGGGEQEVLKNFPSAEALFSAVAPLGDAPVIDELTFYWVLRYTTRAGGRE